MPGRKPKPSALKKLGGNAGKRKQNRLEPEFSGVPVCPDWLEDTAKVEWDRIVEELAALNMLRGVDTACLSSYVQSFARWRSAELQVTRDGQTISEPIVNKSGKIIGHKVKRHPATTIAKDEKAAMHRAAALFGFDPSSRSRISIGDTKTVSALDRFRDRANSLNEAGRTIH